MSVAGLLAQYWARRNQQTLNSARASSANRTCELMAKDRKLPASPVGLIAVLLVLVIGLPLSLENIVVNESSNIDAVVRRLKSKSYRMT